MIKRRLRMIFVLLLCMVVIVLAVNFLVVRKAAIERFRSYESRTECVDTSFGRVTFIDEGNGEPFLIFHGITGGFDQGFDVMKDRIDIYRVIAPSRFGYPGSDMPPNATVDMQAKAFVELLDKLKIDKTFVTATSAGGTIAQRFALLYPERCKGLVLYCSGYPDDKRPLEPVSGMTGPPEFFCNDLAMWLISPLFKPLMGMDSDVIRQIMPMKERKAGIVFDSKVVNKDHTDNYDNYDLKNIRVPVLIIHSEDDKLADSKKARYWSNEIPQCKAVFFSGGGHLMNGNSEDINRVLDEFVEQNK